MVLRDIGTMLRKDEFKENQYLIAEAVYQEPDHPSPSWK
jgi:hypothetical protein